MPIYSSDGVRDLLVRGSARPPGRKDGEIRVRIAHGEFVGFALRVDSSSGEWLADTGNGRWLASQSKVDLEKRLQAEALARRTVTWKRYIVISYTGGSSFSNRSGPSEKRRPREVKEIRLDWEVEDWSEPFAVEGSTTRARRKHRDVYARDHVLDEDGRATRALFESLEEEEARIASDPEECRDRRGREDWSDDDKLPAGAIPYSHGAIETLNRLRDMLGDLDLAVSTLLLGSPEEVAARLTSGAMPMLRSGELALECEGYHDDGIANGNLTACHVRSGCGNRGCPYVNA